jgi:hypothetical protein
MGRNRHGGSLEMCLGLLLVTFEGSTLTSKGSLSLPPRDYVAVFLEIDSSSTQMNWIAVVT